jgi:hypothetical protein
VNYIKKLKSLGFKKIEPIVVCSFNYEKVGRKHLSGHYIISLKEVESNEKYKKETSDFYQKITYYPKSIQNQSYLLKVSNVVSLFIILVGGEFTFVIKDDSIPNDERPYTIYINSIKIAIKSESLNDNFWKRCMEFISNDIKRDLLIKEIFKYG